MLTLDLLLLPLLVSTHLLQSLVTTGNVQHRQSSTTAPAMTNATSATTSPHEHVGFIKASGDRGTMELVWGCVVTIILCTWNVQRQSVPSPHDTIVQKICRKALGMLATVAAPELLTALALIEYLSARWNTQAMHRIGWKRWTAKHAFFADMGGYVLDYHDDKCMLVTSKEILWLAENKMLGPVGLDSSNIDNVASENAFQKIVTSIQLAWFALQSLGRAVNGLAFSLAEVTTLSFVTCAVINMLLWWEKPSGVSARIRLSLPAVTQRTIDSMLLSTKGEREWLVRDLRASSWTTSNSDWKPTIEERFLVLASVALLCLGAGAWHVAAWKYSFPSTTEDILWKISSVAGIVMPMFICLWGVLPDNWSERIKDIFFWTVLILGVVSRIYIILESIVSVRSAPSGIYQRLEWGDFLPHF